MRAAPDPGGPWGLLALWSRLCGLALGPGRMVQTSASAPRAATPQLQGTVPLRLGVDSAPAGGWCAAGTAVGTC